MMFKFTLTLGRIKERPQPQQPYSDEEIQIIKDTVDKFFKRYKYNPRKKIIISQAQVKYGLSLEDSFRIRDKIDKNPAYGKIIAKNFQNDNWKVKFLPEKSFTYDKPHFIFKRRRPPQ